MPYTLGVKHKQTGQVTHLEAGIAEQWVTRQPELYEIVQPVKVMVNPMPFNPEEKKSPVTGAEENK